MEYKILVDVSELEDLADDLELFDQAMTAELIRAITRVLDISQQATRTASPVNFGTYRAAWGTTVTPTAQAVQGKLVNPLVYAAVIEEGGTWPGPMPPVDAIELWVRRKGIAGPDNSYQVAYLIARAIKSRGIKGRHIMREAIEGQMGRITREFEAVPARVARRLGY